MESLRFRSWKYFSLGWWNALASAWFPDVRHFENLTPWIQLRLGLALRDRAWKPTNGHSRKLAQLSMTIFSKFWSRDHYPICIHGSRSRCFTRIAEQVTSGSCWHIFSGRAGLSFREHKRRNGEICPCSCSASKAMFYYPVDPDRVISNHRDSSHVGSCQLTVCWVDFADSTTIIFHRC